MTRVLASMIVLAVVVLSGCSTSETAANPSYCQSDRECKTGSICHPLRRVCEKPGDPIDDCRKVGFECADNFQCLEDEPVWTCQPGPQPVDQGVVAPPTCDDGIKNGNETDVDCGGGGLCPPCDDRKLCKGTADCVSTICSRGRCAMATCTDGITNGRETGPDCGGPCDPCVVGLPCRMGQDCQSGVCREDVCWTAACDDSVRNATETDIDCGGSECDGCAVGQVCLGNADCESLTCVNGACVEASCEDRMQNGVETDIDCGGTCRFAKPTRPAPLRPTA